MYAGQKNVLTWDFSAAKCETSALRELTLEKIWKPAVRLALAALTCCSMDYQLDQLHGVKHCGFEWTTLITPAISAN